MKEIRIPYGKTAQLLHVAQENLQAVLEPAHAADNGKNEAQIVIDALENPIGSVRVSELARGKKKIVLITSDHTRPVPSAITLPLYLKEIRLGAPDAEITILVATGMHRPTTEAEMRAKFGDAIVDHEKIVVHKAMDQQDMRFFGILPSGGELWLNHHVQQADLVVSEGFIEPHFFAGFSGGRKSILPGVASAKTVLYNHNAQFIADKSSRQGSLESNPIHRDMIFAAHQAGLKFILNVLIDGEKKIVAAVAGDLDEAHKAGCALCLARTAVERTGADIVITSNGGYPLDQNVYQSVKGMTAAEACADENGTIIMCAALGDGAGGDDFYHWFADRESASQVTEAICNIPCTETRMDQWEAQILARILEKHDCFFVSGKENRELIEQMHMQWYPDVDSAYQAALAKRGEKARTVVIPDGVGVIVK